MLLIHVAQIDKRKRDYVWLTLLKTHISGDVSVVVNIQNLTQSNAYMSDWIVSGRMFITYTLCARCDKNGRIDDTSRNIQQTEDVDVNSLIKLCTAQRYVLSYFLSSNFRHRHTVIRLIIFFSDRPRPMPVYLSNAGRERERTKRHRYLATMRKWNVHLVMNSGGVHFSLHFYASLVFIFVLRAQRGDTDSLSSCEKVYRFRFIAFLLFL